jgi:hypothetical protein
MSLTGIDGFQLGEEALPGRFNPFHAAVRIGFIILDRHQPDHLVQVIRSCAALVASGSTSVTVLDLAQTPRGHRVQSVSSLNPRPLKIIGTHLSARAARVFTCFAPET